MSWADVTAKCKRILGGIPILGPLVYCKLEDHKSAFREFFIVLVFATATFWLSALLLLGQASMRARGYESLLFSTVRGGELFIFSVGFIGPILINAGDDPKTARAFPGRLWHLFALLLLGIVGTAFHSQVKFAQLNGTPIAGDLDFLFSMSLVIAGGAVVLRYLSMVYRKQTFVPEREIKDKEQDFAREYQQHRMQGAQK